MKRTSGAQYEKAEEMFQAALKEAEKMGGRQFLATSLNFLAALYKAQGKYGEAEPLYQRELAIREEAQEPEHPNVATKLENYALLLRKTH